LIFEEWNHNSTVPLAANEIQSIRTTVVAFHTIGGEVVQLLRLMDWRRRVVERKDCGCVYIIGLCLPVQVIQRNKTAELKDVGLLASALTRDVPT
jgi:hypothetical protein